MRRITKWAGLCGVAGCAVSAVAAGAGEIAVGAGETRVVAVETATTQEAAVRVADRAVIEKTGAGALTLPTGAFTENKPVAVNVREGMVRLETSEPLVTDYPQPTEVMNRAALWMEADTNIQLKEGSADEVAGWLDVRETGDGTEGRPFAYARAVPHINEWLTAYPLRQAWQEKAGVWFRGFGSGCFMNWVRPDGSQEKVQGIRHAFVVQGGPTGNGTFLGQRMGLHPFFQRPNGGTAMWVSDNGENKPLFASRTYLDGVEVDGPHTYYPGDGRHVVEVEALGDSLEAMCFYNDRDMQVTATDGTQHTTDDGKVVNPIFGNTEATYGGDRAGGEYLHEVLLFTNSLTTAERMAVADWLNRKWRGARPPAALPQTTVALAPDTALELAGDFPAPVAVRGDGVVRKTGDGSATIRSANEPRNAARRVEIAGGTLNLGYSLPVVCAAGDVVTSERRLYGPELAAPRKGAAAKSLVKEGSGPLTLDAVPDGVARLVVAGGELRLADPERARRAVPSMPTCATIPEADFEGYRATSLADAYSHLTDGAESRGWHAVVPEASGNESAVFFFDQRHGSPAGWDMVLQDDRSGVLAVKNNASAWCEVQVPEDGEYALSFRAAPRTYHSGEQLEVMIGPDADSLVSCGPFRPRGDAWLSYTLLPVHLTAGTHQLWLKSKMLNNDNCTQFDDFRLERVAETDVWGIPNGGFEVHAADFDEGAFSAANAARVPGFAVTPGESGDGEGEACAFSTFSVRGVAGDWFFNRPWNRPGSGTQFYMSGKGARLETTFTPPAGVWSLRADLCLWRPAVRSATAYTVAARIGVGDETVSLGEVTAWSTKMSAVDWPGTFTADGATPVTLVLTGAAPYGWDYGHGLLDNLALVRASAPGRNLLANGGFESRDPFVWEVAVTPKPSWVGGSSRINYNESFYEDNFGKEHFEGDYCIRQVNDDVVAQRVTFPEGGLYRLSANMAARSAPGSGDFSNGLNPVAFFLARDGVTNWLGCTDSVMMTNYHEYAFLVNIPTAGGTYDVGFRGMSAWGGEGSPSVDRTTLIDAAQLYRVETEKPIGLPRALEIEVAEGARLTLDFDGTNEVRQVRIAGKSYLGVVSLAERPELFGTLNGCGALLVRPRGTVLLLR